jgi:hypothetical protein
VDAAAADRGAARVVRGRHRPDFKENCEKRYQQYRGFRQFRDAWTKAGPRDRDGVLYDAKKHWGSHLHIPLTYRTIEHMVPAAIAHAPKMLYLPRLERFAPNVRNVQLLMDSQMQQADIELPFQDVFKAALMYGLGVGKSLWREEYRLERKIRRSMFNSDRYLPRKKLSQVCTYNDPWFEDVDVFDFAWDPYGADLQTCKWVGHRLWLGLDDCLARIRTGDWTAEGVGGVGRGAAAGAGRRVVDEVRDVWQSRMEASGFGSFQTQGMERGEQIHELWEYHDGERVVCVLDRQYVVKVGESPCVGHFPFAISGRRRCRSRWSGSGRSSRSSTCSASSTRSGRSGATRRRWRCWRGTRTTRRRCMRRTWCSGRARRSRSGTRVRGTRSCRCSEGAAGHLLSGGADHPRRHGFGVGRDG